MNTEWKPIAAHWYAVDAHGAATLCTCEEDARETAAESAQMFPNCAPYTAVQLAPVSAPTSHPIPTGATGEDTDSFDDPSTLAAVADALAEDASNDNAQFAAAYLYRQAKAIIAAPAAGDALDAQRWRSFRRAITQRDEDWLNRMDSALTAMGLDPEGDELPSDDQVDAAADLARQGDGGA